MLEQMDKALRSSDDPNEPARWVPCNSKQPTPHLPALDISFTEPLKSNVSLLTIADSFYIGVMDVAAATSWYIEKLGLQKVPVEMDDPEGCVALGFSKKDQTCIALGPRANQLMGRRRCFTLPTSGRRERFWVLGA